MTDFSGGSGVQVGQPADTMVAPVPQLRVAERRPLYSIKRASDLMATMGVCFAIYGPPGAGKSTLAAQAALSPHAGKVGVIDAEGGSRAYGDRDDIDVITVRDSDAQHDSGMGFAIVERILDDLIARRLTPTDADKFGTIVLDNVSEINTLCMYDTLRTVSRKIEDNDRPDQKDWNTTTSRMLLLFRRWRDYAQDSGTNVIFIAWDKQQEDKVTNVTKKDVAFNPALSNQFPGLVDIVGYLTIKGKGQRTLSFEASTTTAAKFRRHAKEVATTIPGEFVYEFGSPNKPMADLISCLKGNVPFPAAKYAVPQGMVVRPVGRNRSASAEPAAPAITDVKGQIRG